MERLKKPKISEETDKFIEFEIPEGKSEEYDLPDGCEYVGNGTCFETGEHFEYLIKYKLNSEKADE